MMMHVTGQMESHEVLALELARLEQEHRDLDLAISAMQETSGDMLAIRRLKKKKLALKDRIAVLRDRITPDIIA